MADHSHISIGDKLFVLREQSSRLEAAGKQLVAEGKIRASALEHHKAVMAAIIADYQVKDRPDYLVLEDLDIKYPALAKEFIWPFVGTTDEEGGNHG